MPKPSVAPSSPPAFRAAPVVNKVTLKRISQTGSISAYAGSRGKRAPTTDSDFEDDLASAAHTPVHRPTRRRRRVHFPEVSPFMRPAPPAPLTDLEVHVFGRVYPVSVTRKMTLPQALGEVEAGLSVRLDMRGFGLAGEDGGEPWTVEEWEALKKAWMRGGKTEAWLVAVG